MAQRRTQVQALLREQTTQRPELLALPAIGDPFQTHAGRMLPELINTGQLYPDYPPMLPRLHAELFVLGEYMPGYATEAIFAWYEEEQRLLWLDDHLDATDFWSFVQREGLDQWAMPELALLVAQTHFRFLLPWKFLIVERVQDILNYSEEHRRMFSETPQGVQDLQNHDRRLREVSTRITPITFDGQRLTFCVWVHVFGMLYALSVPLHPTAEAAPDEIRVLGMGIGDWFAPR